MYFVLLRTTNLPVRCLPEHLHRRRGWGSSRFGSGFRRGSRSIGRSGYRFGSRFCRFHRSRTNALFRFGCSLFVSSVASTSISVPLRQYHIFSRSQFRHDFRFAVSIRAAGPCQRLQRRFEFHTFGAGQTVCCAGASFQDCIHTCGRNGFAVRFCPGGNAFFQGSRIKVFLSYGSR